MPASPTLTRVLTAAVLVPVVLAIVFYAPLWVIALIIAAVAILAMREFFELAAKAGMTGYPIVAYAIALFLLFEQSQALLDSMSDNRSSARVADLGGSLVGFLFVLALWSLIASGGLREKLQAVASTSFAVIAIALPLSFLVALCDPQLDFVVRMFTRGYGGSIDETGAAMAAVTFLGRAPTWLLFFTLLVVWVGDTVAYFVGRAIGRHKLAPEISPGKTWEGAAGNVTGALLVGWLFARTGMHLPTLLGAAVVGSIAGQIGDLFESMYKRAAGVKDSGALLPGHGGVLDRIDALIFAAPAVWAYFTYVVR